MTLALEWTGQDAFVAEPLRDWTVDGKVAGVMRSAGAFTFATIYGAGHMVCSHRLLVVSECGRLHNQVPYDKPKESLELVRRWLAEEQI